MSVSKSTYDGGIGRGILVIHIDTVALLLGFALYFHLGQHVIHKHLADKHLRTTTSAYFFDQTNNNVL